MNLATLRADWEAKQKIWLDLISAHFPGREKYDWYRACSAARGENTRRNDDTSDDTALVDDSEIAAAHDVFISALHVFYRARDGEHGVLGSKGL